MAVVDSEEFAIVTVRVHDDRGHPIPAARITTAVVPFYQGEDRFVPLGAFLRFWGNTTVVRNAADPASTRAVTDKEGVAMFRVSGFRDPEIMKSAILFAVKAAGYVEDLKTHYVIRVASVRASPILAFNLTKAAVLKGHVSGYSEVDREYIRISIRVTLPDRKTPWINTALLDKDGAFQAEVPPDVEVSLSVFSATRYRPVHIRIPPHLVSQLICVVLERGPVIETDRTVVRIRLDGPDDFFSPMCSYQADFHLRDDEPSACPAMVGFHNTRTAEKRVTPGLYDILVSPNNPNDIAWGEKTVNVPPRSTIEETIDLKPAPKILFTIRPPDGVSREAAGKGLRIDMERQFAGVYRRAGWITVGYESQARVYAATGIAEAYVPGGHLRFKPRCSVDGREYVSEPFERFLFDGEVFEREIQLIPREK